MVEGIRRIVIVGGGTAGWLSAAYLQRVLSGRTASPIQITLIESDTIDTVGVGEATIPSIRNIMQLIGIPEWRLIKETDATFKNAIKFVDWAKQPTDGVSSHFYHPFDMPPVREGFNALAHWTALKEEAHDLPPLDQSVSIQSALCDAELSPKLFASLPYEAPVPYAYHLDAVKLAALLRDVAMERGVERVVDHVETVRLNDEGEIAELVTRDGRAVAGDFFIDCTGFQALLIGKTLGGSFVSYAGHMLCDRAVVCQTKLKTAPRPYTTATAKSAGWTWGIDLFSRQGNGYVYSSKFISDEDAERELLDHLSDAEIITSPRRIEMKVGRFEDVWIKNCLAVGLSAGFIEPLESTGIHFIELALGLFVDYFAEGPALSPLSRKYNQVIRQTYDEVTNFVLIHYILNNRRGLPFWDHYREKVLLPAKLVEQLQVWAYKIPSRTDLESKISIFDGTNYFFIMAGLNTLPPFGNNLSTIINKERSLAVMEEIRRTREVAVEASPAHAEILQKIRGVAG